MIVNGIKRNFRKNESDFRAINLKRSIYISSIFNRKHKTYSNKKKRIKESIDKKLNAFVDNKNNLKNKHNLNNSLSVKNKKNSFKDIKYFINYKKANYNTIIKKDINALNKNKFITKKLFDSNSYTQNEDRKKKYLKKIIIKKKAKLVINNIFLNLSKTNNTTKEKIINTINGNLESNKNVVLKILKKNIKKKMKSIFHLKRKIKDIEYIDFKYNI